MHKFLSVYYFTLLLLNVSVIMYHPQGARLYLLSDKSILVLVVKILCSAWLCVCHVAVWCVSIGLCCRRFFKNLSRKF
jgi:hypothetical protein